MKRLFVFTLMMFCLVGCKSTFNTAPILELNNQPVLGSLSMKQMEKCIITAGLDLGWTMVKIEDGLIRGTLLRRAHTAIVDIPYSTENYSIIYKRSSANLYEDGKGTIHKSYNRWVRNLDKEIGLNMTKEALGEKLR